MSDADQSAGTPGAPSAQGQCEAKIPHHWGTHLPTSDCKDWHRIGEPVVTPGAASLARAAVILGHAGTARCGEIGFSCKDVVAVALALEASGREMRESRDAAIDALGPVTAALRASEAAVESLRKERDKLSADLKEACDALERGESTLTLKDHPQGDCPTWYDGCHCTVDTLRQVMSEVEAALQEGARSERERLRVWLQDRVEAETASLTPADPAWRESQKRGAIAAFKFALEALAIRGGSEPAATETPAPEKKCSCGNPSQPNVVHRWDTVLCYAVTDIWKHPASAPGPAPERLVDALYGTDEPDTSGERGRIRQVLTPEPPPSEEPSK